MPLYLDDRDAFSRAVAREAAHAAVAEHFGMTVHDVELDWRGFPVCHYSGEVCDGVPPYEANILILLAGFVGERVWGQREWWSSADDLSQWMDHVEFDPNDRPDSAFEADLVLALQVSGNDLERLNERERQAHALLTEHQPVLERWRDLTTALHGLAGGQ